MLGVKCLMFWLRLQIAATGRAREIVRWRFLLRVWLLLTLNSRHDFICARQHEQTSRGVDLRLIDADHMGCLLAGAPQPIYEL